MKLIQFSKHARRRLREPRQKGITESDVRRACNKSHEILIKNVPDRLRLKGYVSEAGIPFDIVVVDCEHFLMIVTVIGLDEKYKKKRKKKRVKKAYSR